MVGGESIMSIRKYTSLSDQAYMIFVYALCLFMLVSIMFPIVFIIASSFSSPTAVASGFVTFWPVDFSLLGYKAVFQSPNIITGFMNSVIYTVLGTFINVVMTMMAAYPLSRKDFNGRNGVMLLFACTMFFGGGMIPTYLVVRQLGMLNSIWAMVIPNAMSVWNVIITRTYIQSTIPNELYESTSLDGCDDFRYLWSIVLPLSVPIIAVNVLLYAVGHWNSFFNALIYLNDNDKQPLQIILRSVLVAGSGSDIEYDIAMKEQLRSMKYLLQYALIVVSALPMMILYPFIQKYFIKGIMIGAIKG